MRLGPEWVQWEWWGVGIYMCLYTVVPWYSSWIRTGACHECRTNEYPVVKHFLLQGTIRTPTTSSQCCESWASTKCWNIFFLSECNEHQVWWGLKPMSTEVWLDMWSEWKKWGKDNTKVFCQSTGRMMEWWDGVKSQLWSMEDSALHNLLLLSYSFSYALTHFQFSELTDALSCLQVPTHGIPPERGSYPQHVIGRVQKNKWLNKYLNISGNWGFPLRMSNPWPVGHMRPRMAMDVTQHKIINLLRGFFFWFIIFP